MANGGCSGSEKKIHEEENSRIKQMESEIVRLIQKLRAKDLQLETAAKRHDDELKKIQDITEKKERQIKELEKKDQDKNEKLERLVNEKNELVNEKNELVNEKNELIKELEKKDREKNEEIKRLVNEKKELNDRVEKLLQCWESEGKVCANNCAISAITWICRTRLGYSLCGPQLILIMVYDKMVCDMPGGRDDGEEITTGNLLCANHMDILIKCGVIDQMPKFEFPENIHDKTKMVNELWKQLQNMGEEGVCIIGTKDVSGIGHCYVSYLEKEDLKKEETVRIYDPQQNCPKYFQDLFNDVEIEGLKLHFVNTKQLQVIISKYSHCLHLTDEPYEVFLERLFALSDLR